MTPVQIAAEVLGVDSATLSAERIKGGLTNESWLVQGCHDAVVVRISTANEQVLQLNRQSETQVLACVQQAGIGPEVVLCSPQQRVLVTRKLNADTMTVDAMREPAMVTTLAALLHRLHALPPPEAVQHIDLPAILNGYWHTLDQHGATSPDMDATRAQAMAIAQESASGATRCLCHNDVHHLNVMSNGTRLWLLDWEYAGIGDPFFDLAAVCCYHQYTPTMQDHLLLAYAGTLHEPDRERLQRMCWLFDYIKMLWGRVRALQM